MRAIYLRNRICHGRQMPTLHSLDCFSSVECGMSQCGPLAPTQVRYMFDNRHTKTCHILFSDTISSLRRLIIWKSMAAVALNEV